jgi:hypothetical protein
MSQHYNVRINRIYCIPFPPPTPSPSTSHLQILNILLANAVYMTVGPPGEIQVSFGLSWLSFPLSMHPPIGHFLPLKKMRSNA